MKKIVSLLLSLGFLFCACHTGLLAKADTDLFSLKTLQYSNGTNTAVTSANPLDTITLQLICNTPVDHVAGLSVTIYYNSKLVAFRENAETCHIVDAQADFTSHAVAGTADKSARVNLLWDTTATDTRFSGPVFSLVFDVLGQEQAASAVFTAQINNMFYSDKNQTPVSVGSAPKATLQIGAWDLTPFQALAQGIRYDDETLQNIVAAETIFYGFSSVQASAFVEAYPDLYKAFSNARTIYNRLAQQAAQEQILAESKKFITDYSDLWDLSESAENLLAFESRVAQAQTTYKNLSDAARSRIAAGYVNKLEALLNAIDDRYSDIEEALNFTQGEYKLLWDLDVSFLHDVYESLFATVDNARIAYDHLSAYAKSLVVTQYDKLVRIEALIQQYMQEDEALAALQEKTNAFLQKWSDVFVLNTSNVTVEDKTAIEMAINDSKTLDEEVQAAMKTRIQGLQKLLTVIESYNHTTDNTPIIETVTETITLPGETITEIVTETLPGETVTKTVSKTLYSSLNKTILYLSIVVLVALLMISIPVLLLYSLNKAIQDKKRKVSQMGDE